MALNPATGDWLLVDPDGKDLFLEAAAGKSQQELSRQFPSVSPKDIVNLLHALKGMDFRSVKDSGPAHFCNDCHQGQFPVLAVLNLTEDCNLKCTYCYVGAGEGQKIKMKPETAFRIVDEYLAMNENTGREVNIVMHGGEPLLNYDLVQKLTEYAKPYRDRVRLTIQTNASLLTEERVSFLLENNVSIGVSLDGPPEIHNPTRPLQSGKGSFDQVMRGIRILQSHGVSVGVISVMTRKLAEQIDHVLDFFLENKIYSLSFSPFLPVGRGMKDDDNFVTPEILFEAYKRLIDRIVQFNSNPDRPFDLHENVLTRMARKIFSNRNEFMCTRAPCGSGRDVLGFGVNGDFYACDDFINEPTFWIGSLDRGSIKDQLLKTDVVRKLCNRSMADLPRCRNCVWRSLCGGICHSADFYSGANGVEETAMCGFYKLLIPYLIETYARIPELPILLGSEDQPVPKRSFFFSLSKEEDPEKQLTGEEFAELLRFHQIDEQDTVFFCGEEPLVYPRFPELLSVAVKQSGQSVLVTSGLLFAEEAYTRELFQSGLQFVLISIPEELEERERLCQSLEVYFRIRQETKSEGSRLILLAKAGLVDDSILPVLEKLIDGDRLDIIGKNPQRISTQMIYRWMKKLVDLEKKGIVHFDSAKTVSPKDQKFGITVLTPSEAPEKYIWIDAEDFAGRELTEFPAELLNLTT